MLQRHKLVIIILGIFGLAASLRVVHLNLLPVFADEAIYIRWAQVMRAESTLRFLPLSDGKQPLFMWAVIPTLKFISDPLIAGRFVSVLAGLGTTFGVATAAYLLFKNTRLAVIAGLLWVVLPYAVFFERLALVDALLTSFYIWFFNFLLLSAIRSRWDLSMIAGFSLGFAWLTKSPAVFAIALSPSLLLLLPKYSQEHLFRFIFHLLTALVIATAMYNVLRLGPEFHMIAIRNRDYIHPLTQVLTHPLDPFIPHLKDTFNFYFYLLTPLGLLFALWGIFAGQRHHLKPRLLLALWWLFPVLAQAFIAKGFTARYLLFTTPFAVIIAGYAIEHVGLRSQKHLLFYLAAALVVVPSLWWDLRLITQPATAPLPRIERSGYLEEWTAGFGLKEVSSALRQAAATGPVVVGSEGFFGTPFDALGMYLNSQNRIRIVGVGVDIDSIPSQLVTAVSDNQVFLVVNSSRFHADPHTVPGLKLLAVYPKAHRPDNTREELLFFQVTSP